MDDPRFEWLKDRVNSALDIKDSEVFDDLLNREDGEAERGIAQFLNDTPDEDAPALLFYKLVQEEEEEIEVECGTKSISYDLAVEGQGQSCFSLLQFTILSSFVQYS